MESDPFPLAQDQGLQEVETLQRRPGPGAFTRLKQALKELVAGSRRAESLPFLAADSEVRETHDSCLDPRALDAAV